MIVLPFCLSFDKFGVRCYIEFKDLYGLQKINVRHTEEIIALGDYQSCMDGKLKSMIT